jgi:capsular exopolysaccharide synthesis family protein
VGKIFEALEKSNFEDSGVHKDKAAPDIVSGKTFTVSPSLFEERQVSFEYKKIDENLITISKPYGIEAEQFKKLRTALLFPNNGTPPRSILVTSAIPDEGKSFVAANLAVSIAQNIDKHVLLMDCDLRLPTIHTCFGFEKEPGLCEYLSGEQALDTLFLRSVVDKLTILPGGGPVSNPSELLSSDQMSNLLINLPAEYSNRYIVIDSPPPQLTSETAALAKQVDAVLLVIKHGTTRREHIADLIDVLGKDKIIGVVLNQFNTQLSRNVLGSYYGGYSNKYYKNK